MQKFKCHKEVKAAKIRGIDFYSASRTGRLLLGGTSVEVNESFLDKHKPEVGGYFVEYGDGYQSYSPAAAFESGYTVFLIEEDSETTTSDAISVYDEAFNVYFDSYAYLGRPTQHQISIQQIKEIFEHMVKPAIDKVRELDRQETPQ